MALTLSNFYTLPADVSDQLGLDSTQLQLDDDNLATGLTIEALQTAAVGATVISVTAIQSFLMAGACLEFRGAAIPANVPVVVSAYTGVGSTALPVQPLTAQVNQGGYARDNGINLVQANRLVKACQYGTAQVNLYLLQQYNQSDLFANAAQRGSVNRWATILAAKWLTSRRGMSPPGSVAEDAKEALDELKRVRYGQLRVEGIGVRSAGVPFFTNVTVEIGYAVAKARMQPSISEMTPTQYGQWVSWSAVFNIGSDYI